MDEQMECMCLECGISLYLSRDLIAVDEISTSGRALVKQTFCSECGGVLMVIGRAGDEPRSRVQDDIS